LCKGKCGRAEEIEEGDRNRERNTDVENEYTETEKKRRRGRHYNEALQKPVLVFVVCKKFKMAVGVRRQLNVCPLRVTV
jgi:hypothetical protein